ncbi:MAG: hypothetical protein DRN12_01980, partial [Thermoplasmata archaeon]
MKRFLAICFTILLLTPVVNSSNMVRKIGNLNQINCQIKSDEFNEKEDGEEWLEKYYDKMKDYKKIKFIEQTIFEDFINGYLNEKS